MVRLPACALAALTALFTANIANAAIDFSHVPENVMTSHPSLAGAIIFDTSIGYFSQFQSPDSKGGQVTESGSLRETVVRENNTGTLDFYYTAVPNLPTTLQDLVVGVDPNLNEFHYISFNASGDPTLNPTGTFPRTPDLLVRSADTDLHFGGDAFAIMLFEHDISYPGSDDIPLVAPAAVPEPASLSIISLAGVAILLRKRAHPTELPPLLP